MWEVPLAKEATDSGRETLSLSGFPLVESQAGEWLWQNS